MSLFISVYQSHMAS